MKCKYCGQKIIKVRTANATIICNDELITYWLSSNPDNEILTPNGESIYCKLKGNVNTAHGIGRTRHTCFE